MKINKLYDVNLSTFFLIDMCNELRAPLAGIWKVSAHKTKHITKTATIISDDCMLYTVDIKLNIGVECTLIK